MTLRAEQTALSLEDLRLVAAVGHAGSLAGAARRIAVNHASAWRRLGALEQRLGVRLFERSRTGYSPTPAGRKRSRSRARGAAARRPRATAKGPRCSRSGAV